VCSSDLNVLVVPAASPHKTMAEVLAFLKAHPEKMSFASSGNGSSDHITAELFWQQTGTSGLHIPYKGGAPALQDLLAGRVAAWYATYATAQPHIESGRLIPLASTGAQRLAALPNVPTIAESGYPGFSATNWYAFIATSKMSPALQERWNAELVKVLKSPDAVAARNKHGLPAQPGTREELARYISAESNTWGKLIRERKITGQ